MKAIHEGFHQKYAALARHLHHLLALLARDRHWLLAQDVFASLQCPNSPCTMQAVWKRDVDRLNLGVRDDRFIRVIYTYIGGESIEIGGMATITTTDRNQFTIGGG